MPEHQTIEYKESWHDEFLEWICGYANAYGGTLYIGKNDNGDVVGLNDKDIKKLLEVIPNKITDTMGIVADVNLLYEGKLQYIEIIVDKYPSLISYHGKYFYRSGRTIRMITGKELDKAILKSQGRTWDGMPIPKLQVTDLRREAMDLLKEKVVRRGRLTEEEAIRFRSVCTRIKYISGMMVKCRLSWIRRKNCLKSIPLSRITLNWQMFFLKAE